MTDVRARSNLANELGSARARPSEAAGSLLPIVECRSGSEDTETAQEDAERLYRLFWETTTDAVLIIDSNSIIRFANPSVLQVFGHLPTSLINMSLGLLQPEHIREVHQQGMRRYLESGVKKADWRAVESVGLHASGAEFPIELAFSELVLANARLFVAFVRDTTVRKRAEAALLAEKELAETTLRSIGDAVISTDADGAVVFLNQMAECLTGCTGVQATGRDVHGVLELVDQTTYTKLTLPLDLHPAAAGPGLIPLGTLLRSADGAFIPIEGCTAPIKNLSGAFSGFVIAFRDVSLSRKLAEQVSYQASHDALTGLPNRSEFEMRLREALALASKEGRPCSLLYLDLDQFRIINDTCGHFAGDQLLIQLAGVLASNVGETNVLARLGGDEFGVLLDNCEPTSAARIAEKLRCAVADFTFIWNGRPFATSASIGLVSYNDHGLTPTVMLSQADEACYVAKDEGRNRVRSYEVGDEALGLRHSEMEWVGLIRQALVEDRFVLFSQPIVLVDNPGEPCTHFEFLLRMRDTDGQLVLPMAFMPAAERFGLMPLLDRWVIRAVTEEVAARIRTSGVTNKSCFAVNLSGASLADLELPQYITSCLQEAEIPPEVICFEITETVAIGNLSSASNLIKEVKQLGCKFSLDDFGSGMSSFSYLKHLPVDYLKIDGSFVRNIATDEIDRAIVVSINEIGHLMGLRTIAEFVEDENIMKELRLIGVDYAQGYYVGRPVPWQSSKSGEMLGK